MKTSDMFNLDLKDLVKGLIVAAGGAAIVAVQGTLKAGVISFNWKSIGITALAAGLSYLAKNFFTPAQIVQKADSGDV
jgi:hypothetical protein